MSGRWLWCPDDWRVVPVAATTLMANTARVELGRCADRIELGYVVRAISRAILAAPEPPSGWSRDTPPREEQILVQRFSNGNFEVITAYTRWPKVSYWWTPLPPPPEVKP